MRHKVDGRKFNRTTSHREAMLRNLVANLFEHGRIITTVPKAKEARRLAEKCITIAKKGIAAEAAAADEVEGLKKTNEEIRAKIEAAGEGDTKALQSDLQKNGNAIAAAKAKTLHYRRLALKKLHRQDVVKTLFEEVAPKYLDRNGGYTRHLKAGFRLGDSAPRALFELV